MTLQGMVVLKKLHYCGNIRRRRRTYSTNIQGVLACTQAKCANNGTLLGFDWKVILNVAV